MLLIACPWCGPRDEPEFACAGELSARPAQADDAGWADYLFFRDNVRGPRRELWRHAGGCGQWFTVQRDTVTHEITP